MSAALWALVISAAAAQLSSGERVPSVMLVVVPKDIPPRAPTSTFFSALEPVLRAHTHFDLRSAEQMGLDAARAARCERGERFSCWLASVPSARALWVVNLLPIAANRERVSTT